MLLRTLRSRLGARRPAGSRLPSTSASASLSQSVKYEPKPRTDSGSWLFARTRHLSGLHLQNIRNRHVPAALSGLAGLGSVPLTDPEIWTARGLGQSRFYSSNIVKTVLKSGLKPAALPGKKVPKGPRTKQPSRANQPPLNEDQVTYAVRAVHSVTCWRRLVVGSVPNPGVLVPVGHDAVHRLRNGGSVPPADTLPRLDEPGFPGNTFTTRYDSEPLRWTATQAAKTLIHFFYCRRLQRVGDKHRHGCKTRRQRPHVLLQVSLDRWTGFQRCWGGLLFCGLSKVSTGIQPWVNIKGQLCNVWVKTHWTWMRVAATFLKDFLIFSCKLFL